MVRKLNPPRNYPIPECACCDAKDERIRELEKALRKISDGDYSDAFELHSIVTNALASSPDANVAMPVTQSNTEVGNGT